jgi:hypothetical protein
MLPMHNWPFSLEFTIHRARAGHFPVLNLPVESYWPMTRLGPTRPTTTMIKTNRQKMGGKKSSAEATVRNIFLPSIFLPFQDNLTDRSRQPRDAILAHAARPYERFRSRGRRT